MAATEQDESGEAALAAGAGPALAPPSAPTTDNLASTAPGAPAGDPQSVPGKQRPVQRRRRRRPRRLGLRLAITISILIIAILAIAFMLIGPSYGGGRVIIESVQPLILLEGGNIVVTGRVLNVDVNSLRLGDLDFVFDGDSIVSKEVGDGQPFSGQGDRHISLDSSSLFQITIHLDPNLDFIDPPDPEVRVRLYYLDALQDSATFDLDRLLGIG